MVKIYYSFIQKNQKDKFVNYVLSLNGDTALEITDNFSVNKNYYSVSFSGDIIMVAVSSQKVCLSLERVEEIDYKAEVLNFATGKEISKISSLQGYYVLLTKKQSMAKYFNCKLKDVTFENEVEFGGKQVEVKSVSSLFDEYIFSFASTEQDYEKILIM